jgi:hypothetical protein
MQLKVVGAGLGRTGTTSLKIALERLTGGRCCHMFEVFEHPESVPLWHAAARGETVDWQALMDRYSATVDWPAAAFWPELAAASPEAIVLLSTRATPEQWWASMERTIVGVLSAEVPPENEQLVAHRAMVREVFAQRFTPDWRDPQAAMAAYTRHNERVRGEVPAERLLEWQPGDGWEPVCAALGVAVPSVPFPHENTTPQFRARMADSLAAEPAS